MKDNRGEISIQMIITMIVVLVMAGICVFMLTGEDGLFVPKKDNEITNNILNTNEITNNTVDTNETQEQNVTNNENGGFTEGEPIIIY